jgi:hypothetical protein
MRLHPGGAGRSRGATKAGRANGPQGRSGPERREAQNELIVVGGRVASTAGELRPQLPGDGKTLKAVPISVTGSEALQSRPRFAPEPL